MVAEHQESAREAAVATHNVLSDFAIRRKGSPRHLMGQIPTRCVWNRSSGESLCAH